MRISITIIRHESKDLRPTKTCFRFNESGKASISSLNSLLYLRSLITSSFITKGNIDLAIVNILVLKRSILTMLSNQLSTTKLVEF